MEAGTGYEGEKTNILGGIRTPVPLIIACYETLSVAS
jgi:hypothetical protein